MSRSKKGSGTAKTHKGLVLFGGAFAAVGLGIMTLLGAYPMYLSVTSGSWVEVPCTIISSSVGSHSSSEGGNTYSIDIEYE